MRFLMKNRKNKLDARPGRLVRTRLTRVLVMAVAGPVMAGSLAYAAGVEPVRRRVDEFLKGTAGLLRTAESSTRDFHLSPNPSGQGVLVMPLGDRGPRAPAQNLGPGFGSVNAKRQRHNPSGDESQGPPGESKWSTRDESRSGSDGSKKKAETSSDDSKESGSGSGSRSSGSHSDEEKD
jgi:hypothetical protein